MAITLARAGANSASFLISVYGAIAERTLDESAWAQLPSGKLKDFVSRRFVNVDGDADFTALMEAAADAGFRLVCLRTPEGPVGAQFDLSTGPTDPNFPDKPAGILLVWAASVGSDLPPLLADLSVSYSASE